MSKSKTKKVVSIGAPKGEAQPTTKKTSKTAQKNAAKHAAKRAAQKAAQLRQQAEVEHTAQCERVQAALIEIAANEGAHAATLSLHFEEPTEYSGVLGISDSVYTVAKEDAEPLDRYTQVLSLDRATREFEEMANEESEHTADSLQGALKAVAMTSHATREGIVLAFLREAQNWLNAYTDVEAEEAEVGVCNCGNYYCTGTEESIFPESCIPGGYDEHGNGNDPCTFNPETGEFNHVTHCPNRMVN